jgi:methionine-rich copper-binding protein CopC
MRLIRSATLVAVLLLAQAAVAAHVDLEDSHPAGEACALCAGHSLLGSGNVGVMATFDVVSSVEPRALFDQGAVSQDHRSFFLARGPPTAS